MDIQFILMVILFVAAIAYVVRLVYRAMTPKAGSCNTGCGKCAANFDKIVKPNK